MRHIPVGLTLLRAALGPVMLWLAFSRPVATAMGACLLVALLSDIFDGVIARRLGVATEGVRRLDSIADSIFYVSALAGAWHLYPQALTERIVPLVALIGLELVRYAYDLRKFGREASYHMWSSKAWGLALFAGFFSLLALGVDGIAVDLAIYAGVVCDLEGLGISVVLRRSRCDVPSLVHALRDPG
jgi:CDP-diacylglycerol--glycerol-3-phosphate 3-phosphatidyltransferase